MKLADKTAVMMISKLCLCSLSGITHICLGTIVAVRNVIVNHFMSRWRRVYIQGLLYVCVGVCVCVCVD